MRHTAGVDSLRGQLLIAGPTLGDPNFVRSVVLVLEHSDEGAMGLVLNRPVEATVDEAAPELADVVDGDELLFQGGPVQPSGVIVLAEFADPEDAAMIVVDGVGPLAASADLDAVQVVEGRRARVRGPRGLGTRAARVRARARRLDHRARAGRGRVRGRRRAPVGGGP